MLRLYVQHRLADQLLIQRAERGDGAERQVGGVFHLHQAPVVVLAEDRADRTTERGVAVEGAMQLLGREGVGHGLGTRPIVDPHEGVVGHGVADAVGGQLAGQPVVAVAVELQAERRPGRDAQIDQAQLGIHEIEIVVQALAAVRPDEGLVRLLVVPGFIGVAGFHRR